MARCQGRTAEQVLVEASQQPRRVSNDQGTFENHKLSDLIAMRDSLQNSGGVEEAQDAVAGTDLHFTGSLYAGVIR